MSPNFDFNTKRLWTNQLISIPSEIIRKGFIMSARKTLTVTYTNLVVAIPTCFKVPSWKQVLMKKLIALIKLISLFPVDGRIEYFSSTISFIISW